MCSVPACRVRMCAEPSGEDTCPLPCADYMCDLLHRPRLGPLSTLRVMCLCVMCLLHVDICVFWHLSLERRVGACVIAHVLCVSKCATGVP